MLRSVPGAPGLPAARAAHERARAWAAEGIRQLLQQLGGGGGGFICYAGTVAGTSLGARRTA